MTEHYRVRRKGQDRCAWLAKTPREVMDLIHQLSSRDERYIITRQFGYHNLRWTFKEFERDYCAIRRANSALVA